jgi:hypothetical protein
VLVKGVHLKKAVDQWRTDLDLRSMTAELVEED